MTNNVHKMPTSESLKKIPSLTPGGGGGDSGNMEKRLDRLETKFDGLEERLTRIEVSLAKIDAKLDSKIDYKWLTVYVLGIIAVIMRSEIASWLISVSAN